MNLLFSSHSENRRRIHHKFNAANLGECINKFQQEQQIVKKRYRININVFFFVIQKFHNFILFIHHEKFRFSGKSTNNLLFKNTPKYAHTHFFLTCFDLMKPNKGKTHDPASMKWFSICHILQTLSGFCILFYTQYIISFPIKKLVNLFAFKIRFYQFSSKKDQVKIATKYKLDV